MLNIEDITIGMQFKALILWNGRWDRVREGRYFRAEAVNPFWVQLRCTEEGSHWMALPVAVPEGQKNGKDYFYHVQVSIKTLNLQLEKLEDE